MSGACLVCVGGATIDHTYVAAAPIVPASSNPVSASGGFGGVARNVAENLARLGVPVHLVSAIGSDAGGNALLADMERLGIGHDHVARHAGANTAQYGALIGPDGDLFVGFADMAVLATISPERLAEAAARFAAARLVFADCNLPAETLAALIALRHGHHFKLAVDAVSVAKSARLPADLHGIDYLFLNRDEAQAVLGVKETRLAGLADALRCRGADAVIVTGGPEGAFVANASGGNPIAPQARHVVNVTGAGDALIAGTLWRLFCGDALALAVRTGSVLAGLTIGTAHSVRQDLSPDLLAGAVENEEQAHG